MSIGQEIGNAQSLFMNFLNDDISINWEHLNRYDWISAMKNCMQDKEFHAEGDVYTHTQMVVEELMGHECYQNLNDDEKKMMLLSALLHDVAKPKCTVVERGRIRSPNHAKVGEKMAREILWDLDFSFREKICSMVRLHGLPVWVFDKKNPVASITKSSLRLNNHHLWLFSYCDMLGRICKDKNEKLQDVDLFKELCLENNCLFKPMAFENSISRFKFFVNNEHYPPIIYDNTKFEVIVLSGLPGSGKDTFCNNMDLPVVSLDDLRQEHKVKVGDKKAQGKIIQLAYEQAKSYCRKKQGFIWNSTNLTVSMRQKFVNAILPYNPKIKIVYVESSLKNVFERRQHYIKKNKLIGMLRQLEIPQLDEAHDVEYIINR